MAPHLSVEGVSKEFHARGKKVLALVVVVCNEAINRAEAFLLRWRPKEERGAQRELF